MPRSRPRTGWQVRREPPENPYSESQLDDIAAAFEEGVGQKLKPQERTRLLANAKFAAREFYIFSVYQKGPKKGEIKAALTNLRVALDSLSQVVEELDDATIIALVQQRGEFYEAAFGEREQGSSPSDCLIGSLSFVPVLSAEARAAIEALDNPHPRSFKVILDLPRSWLGVYPINLDQSPIEMFIGRLADIFYNFSDQEPECHRDWSLDKKYKGNFPPFVKACLTPLENRERTALGRTIQEALREWRKWRDDCAEANIQDGEDESTE